MHAGLLNNGLRSLLFNIWATAVDGLNAPIVQGVFDGNANLRIWMQHLEYKMIQSFLWECRENTTTSWGLRLGNNTIWVTKEELVPSGEKLFVVRIFGFGSFPWAATNE